jgi:hypothetical protein
MVGNLFSMKCNTQLLFYSFKMVGLKKIMWELYMVGDYNWFECAFITNLICTHFMHIFLLKKCEFGSQYLYRLVGWKHIEASKIVITNKSFFNYFWIEYGHYILDFFFHFKYIWLALDLI